MSPFIIENARIWAERLGQIFPEAVPEYFSWTEPTKIAQILSAICGRDLHYVLLPRGGTGGFSRAVYDKARDQLELITSDRTAYVCRPQTLEFCHLKSAPENSFFFIVNTRIPSVNTYANFNPEYEEVVEFPSGRFSDRSVWDAGGFTTKDGREVPLSQGSRLLYRVLSGNLMVASKASGWSGSIIGDGMHSQMSARAIAAIGKQGGW